ncbi:MAG: amidohydrolase family protein [Caldicoprobacterales bacterium]|jgi:predicted TIM-barrel fold metal-dependent hydrolase|nr:amidohydrolase family protein [Clostridiales bacterium]
MKIDIHAHVFPKRGYVRDVFLSVEEQLQANEEQGVDMAVILPLIHYEIVQTPQIIEDIAELCRQYPDKFVFFMNLDPRMFYRNPEADFSPLIEYYLEMGAKGVGEMCANLPFDHPLMENMFSCIDKYELPLIFHIAPHQYGYYGILDDENLTGLEGALQKFPNIKFLGHSADFWSEISGDQMHGGYPDGPVAPGGRVVELMRKYDNMMGDLSAGSGLNAIMRDREFGIWFLNEFQDKLYFGHDFCSVRNTKGMVKGMTLSRYMDGLLEEGAISREVYEKICSGNARKLLKL